VMIGFSLLLFHFYFKRQDSNVFTLLLIGIVCGSLFSSVTNFMTMLVDPSEFTAIQDAVKQVFWKKRLKKFTLVGSERTA